MVKQFSIAIHSFNEIQDFVSLATVQPFQVLVGNEQHQINGKSFIGMMSLDYSHPVSVQVECDETAFSQFRLQAARFLAN